MGLSSAASVELETYMVSRRACSGAKVCTPGWKRMTTGSAAVPAPEGARDTACTPGATSTVSPAARRRRLRGAKDFHGCPAGAPSSPATGSTR